MNIKSNNSEYFINILNVKVNEQIDDYVWSEIHSIKGSVWIVKRYSIPLLKDYEY